MKSSHSAGPILLGLAALGTLASTCSGQLSSVQPAEPIRGMIGVGTWATQAEFKDIKVIKDGKTLYASDFSKGMPGWKTTRGNWQLVDGALRQKSDEQDTRALFGDPNWSNYTLTLKARKLGGDEGFLVFFGAPDSSTKSWWNIGGWRNSQHGIQAPGIASEPVAGRIETGRWYDIKVELRGNTVRTFLANQLVQTATQTTAQKNFGHPLIPDLVADPSVVEIEGTFYLYGTTDGAGAGLSTSGLPVVWKSRDFLNWSFTGTLFADNFDAKYWAPSHVIAKGGRYYLFPTLDNKITALVGDSPTGPFRTFDGQDVNRKIGWQPFPITVGNPIDAEIFRDDDGSHYMVWSQRGIGKLNADFSGFDGAPTLIRTKRGGYSEGPYLFKRNGIYYYLYTLEGHENYKYAYMMSRTSPLGPWEAPEQDIIAATDHAKGIYGPGHGSFFSPRASDQWYFVYLEYGRSGTTRQVWADEMHFNADGTIRPIELTLEGVGALRADSNANSPNLALGKRATASSTCPDFRVPPIADPKLNRIETYAPGNALDGSNGSRWLAREDESQSWYQLDLGQARDIRRTELYFVQPTQGHAYHLDYSLDGKSWQRYGGHDTLIMQSPHSDAKAVRARYLKLTYLKGAPGLWEFRVF